MSDRHVRLAALFAIVCIIAAPYLLSPFSITLLNYIGIYALVAIGLTLLTGIGGIVSFGQAAFVGVAAYATAWMTALNGGCSPGWADSFLRWTRRRVRSFGVLEKTGRSI